MIKSGKFLIMTELQTLIQRDPLFKKFKKQLKTFSGLSRGDRIIVSVSGGLDSVALLLLMNSTKIFKLIVGHINHNLRPESDNDKSFVEDLSGDLNIPYYFKSLDPKSRNKGTSVEEWGRINRYSFLKKIAKQTNSKWIMTAHHGNDQAETVLMNLARQSGVSGLRGIAKQDENLLRPFLAFNQTEITNFSKRTGCLYKEDSTNSDITIPRNFIRHRVVKPWEDEVAGLISGLQGSVQHFSEWKTALDFLIIKSLFPNVKKSDKKFDIPMDMMITLPKMAKVRLVHLLMDDSGNELWSKHQLNMLNQFINKDNTGNVHELHNGWRLLHNRDVLIGEKISADIQKNAVELYPNVPLDYNEYRYELILNGRYDPSENTNTETINWSILKNRKLEIRTWKKGDSFQPLGMDGHQKISDFLINEKVDCLAKESQSVLTADGEIVWVCGRRISDRVKLTESTSETAFLICQPIQT